ncbi:MAG: Rieske 2Fe-2S domain-containing protein [Alphaproteobacteria bacterium]|nr:Rieske 2Fe-2S domain-containing protein [Alphaproteobacteria bacterium]
MSVQDAGFESGVAFPSNALSEVPFRVYTDPEQYRLEQERIFKGPTWSYLCLAAEIPEPGDWVATTIGEVAVIVARGPDGAINAFVNRCAHRGNLLCLTERGHGREITCIYHGWTYDLAGHLTGVAFERGIKRQGGMPPEFRKEEHHLQRLRVGEVSGLVFGTFSDEVEDVETYLGPLVVSGIRRVLNRPARIIGRSTQILPNNWKLYAENVKDTYHASILHAFLTTFRINRLSQPGSINIDDSGGNHFSQAKMDYAAEDAEYKAAQLRSDTDMKLADNSIIDPIDEYGDQVSVQILTVFPNMVLQQIRNTIAVRVLRPRGVDKSELDWIHLGFADDDEDMTERRLRHGNLVGPAGYIALEDGCVGGFVQRALHYNDDDAGIVMMGGHDAQSQTFRASEAAIRGFWKKYRALLAACAATQAWTPSRCASRSATSTPPMPTASTMIGSKTGPISSPRTAAI